MIETLIFDFGDVFINLDKQGARQKAQHTLGISEFSPEMTIINQQYETGKISTAEFLSFYSSCFPDINHDQLAEVWNFIIRDFPYHRLQFLKELQKSDRFNLVLLSNTNDLHIHPHLSFTPRNKHVTQWHHKLMKNV